MHYAWHDLHLQEDRIHSPPSAVASLILHLESNLGNLSRSIVTWGGREGGRRGREGESGREGGSGKECRGGVGGR